jgi:hypothetical protein
VLEGVRPAGLGSDVSPQQADGPARRVGWQVEASLSQKALQIVVEQAGFEGHPGLAIYLVKAKDAIQRAALAKGQDDAPPQGTAGRVGASRPRREGDALLAGKAHRRYHVFQVLGDDHSQRTDFVYTLVGGVADEGLLVHQHITPHPLSQCLT